MSLSVIAETAWGAVSRYVIVGSLAGFVTVAGSGLANALSLSDAISVALDSNPDIGQAIENREAIEFELRQAKGLFLPSVDLEAGSGVRRLDNPTRRSLGRDDDSLQPTDIGVVVTQKLYDGGRARAEVDRQAARVDGASLRILERSEFIALQVTKEYLEYLLQAEIVSASAQNLRDHRRIASNIRSGTAGGTLTEADNQQARERVLAARARLETAEEELEAARIRFRRLTGVPLNSISHPGSPSRFLPDSLDQAIGLGRTNNPRVHLAKADIDAAHALVRAAKAETLPEIVLQGRARAGHDIDGVDGRTNDLEAKVLLRWNLYRGGIKRANVQEHVRRASEQRMILHQIHREIEQNVMTSWDRRGKQLRLAKTLRTQAAQSGQLVNSYRQQYSVGNRSLLDVLDAQNTRYNTDVLAKTAQFASLFAEYTLLASTGQLLKSQGLSAPKQSDPYAREEFGVPPTPPAETYKRVSSRQVNNLPLDLLAPLRRQ